MPPGDIVKPHEAAAELVALNPDVQPNGLEGLPAARALRKKTRTIPIVFTKTADPVGFGLVASIPHAGGNLTGFMAWELSIGGKWLELLREVAPDLKRVSVHQSADTALCRRADRVRQNSRRRDAAVLDLPVHDDRAVEAPLS